MTDIHHHFMQQALALARLGELTVSPNPMVGCVIVRNNEIVGHGYHKSSGEPHAEIYALQHAKEHANNATTYITLEPCCHHGQTPPCIDALIKSKIKDVFIACLDPNPLVAGKGALALRQAGITVHVGTCKKQAQQLNKIFFHFMQSKRPYVIAKWAMSLDGKTTVNGDDKKTISSQVDQQHVHKARQIVDAILIGANTARHDNPQLTTRLNNLSITPKHPTRIILVGKNTLPSDLQLFSNNTDIKTIIAATQPADSHWLKQLKNNNIEVLSFKSNNHRIDLNDLLTALGQRNITNLLVEGGMQVTEQFMQANLIDEYQVFMGHNIIGPYQQKKPVHGLKTSTHFKFTKGKHYV